MWFPVLYVAYMFLIFTNAEKRILMNDAGVNYDTLQRLEAEITSLRKTVTEMNSTINSLKGSKETTNPSIAFMAIMDKDLVNPSANHIVIFNHVLTNIGNAYHPYSGTFIAPASGTYTFTMNLAAPNTGGTHHMYVYMEKNGAEIGYLFFDNHAQYWVKRSDTATVHLNIGDSVYIKIVGGSGSRTLAGQYHSNFSGFLIQAD